ncbi:MAG: arsenate reductase (glutaredoxin) [Deltaproteobacteria bacterium]|nr:arsenate reductase (glutaredoxin) [Deltaproteobacteria bacterium]
MMELICKKTCSTCRKAVALLDAEGVEYRYREYTEEPLTEAELRATLKMLGVGPKAVLRKNDKAWPESGLTGAESDEALIQAMLKHPTLVQRPIGIKDGRAVLGRPPEALLSL